MSAARVCGTKHLRKGCRSNSFRGQLSCLVNARKYEKFRAIFSNWCLVARLLPCAGCCPHEQLQHTFTTILLIRPTVSAAPKPILSRSSQTRSAVLSVASDASKTTNQHPNMFIAYREVTNALPTTNANLITAHCVICD